MARVTLVWDKTKGKMVLKHEVPRVSAGPSVIGDIQDVHSLVDNKVYSSRKHYNDMLRAHDLRIAGNDFNNQPMTTPKSDVPGLKDDIARAISERS